MSRGLQLDSHPNPHLVTTAPDQTVEQLGTLLATPVFLFGPDLEIKASYPPRDAAHPQATDVLVRRARQLLSDEPLPRRAHLYDGDCSLCVSPIRCPGWSSQAGYLVIECPPDTPTPALTMRASQACEEIAAWMRWQRELDMARKNIARELALAVLTEDTGVTGFWAEKLRHLGVPLAPFYRPAVLHLLRSDTAGADPMAVLSFLQRAFEQADPQLYVGYRADACYCTHGCYCVFFPDRRLGGLQTAGVMSDLRRQLGRLHSSLGSPFIALVAEHSVGTDVVHRVFADLVRLLPVALREESEPAVHTPQRYSLQRLLASVDPEAADEFVTRIIGSLLDNDTAHGTGIVRTLAVYLESGCSVSGAASRLYFHRNTVRRHLQRAEETLGVSLNDPDARFQLHLAVSLLRQAGLRTAQQLGDAHSP